MFEKSFTGCVCGIKAKLVEVEVSVSPAQGVPQFALVGLPDQAVKEAKDRVITAIENSGFGKIEDNVTVNLAPADVRKEGTHYDLSLALTLLAALKKVQIGELGLLGELALSGDVRRVDGILPIVLEMCRQGKKGVLVPADNAAEASVVEGIEVYAIHSLREAVQFLQQHHLTPIKADLNTVLKDHPDAIGDFADVKGHEGTKRALEVAVAGGHNVLMIGPPGAGKTLLARCVPSILPPLSIEEALEVMSIHSVVGARLFTRPFRFPHHTISDCGLIGGGTHPRPGEVSLAHRGVLFLDEFPEFRRHVLEVLRQPLEDGVVTVSRAAAAVTFPARFMLIAAMNPCPCGYLNDPHHVCRCSHRQIMMYRSKISGPLLDRIDMQLELTAVSPSELIGAAKAEPSEKIRERVLQARAIQRERYKSIGFQTNSEVTTRYLADACKLSVEAQNRMRFLLESLQFSARAYDRILRVARTVADLAGEDAVTEAHVLEASNWRATDQNYWRD